MEKASLVATLTTPAPPPALDSLAGEVEWLEVRADLAGDPDPDALRQRFGGRLLYAAGALAGEERRRRLAAAAGRYDLIELDADRDRGSALLARIPASRRLLSWRGPALGGPALERRFAALAEIPARFYRLVPAAADPGEAAAPLALLRALGRRDVLAWASGTAGFWSRLVAPRLGCPMVFADLAPGSSGERPSLAQLVDDYGLPALPPVARLYGVVGRGAVGSLSPRLHNGAYRRLGLAALYLPIESGSEADFAGLWRALGAAGEALGLPWSGATVVAPYKEAALALADEASAAARRAAGANLLARVAGDRWRADTTDPQGVLEPLAELGVELRGRTAAVIGGGAAGRAVAVALAEAGARVTLVHRRTEVGRRLARELGVGFCELAELRPGAFAVVVNATPVGRDGAAAPLDTSALTRGTAVVDLVYGAVATPLVTAARRRGCPTADGRDVLLAETRHQLRGLTGQRIGAEVLRSLLHPAIR